MNPLMSKYSDTAEELTHRISELIPSHPEILEMETAWELFKIPDFECSDLEPTFYQAQWALNKAKAGGCKK